MVWGQLFLFMVRFSSYLIWHSIDFHDTRGVHRLGSKPCVSQKKLLCDYYIVSTPLAFNRAAGKSILSGHCSGMIVPIPTEHFTILNPQNLSIGVSEHHESMDSQALILRNVRSGHGYQEWITNHYRCSRGCKYVYCFLYWARSCIDGKWLEAGRAARWTSIVPPKNYIDFYPAAFRNKSHASNVWDSFPYVNSLISLEGQTSCYFFLKSTEEINGPIEKRIPKSLKAGDDCPSPLKKF